jgi:hypothetical protein
VDVVALCGVSVLSADVLSSTVAAVSVEVVAATIDEAPAMGVDADGASVVTTTASRVDDPQAVSVRRVPSKSDRTRMSTS